MRSGENWGGEGIAGVEGEVGIGGEDIIGIVWGRAGEETLGEEGDSGRIRTGWSCEHTRFKHAPGSHVT